jgi:hypothetical protein
MALRQVFSFPYQFSFHRLFYVHHLSSGAGTIGQLVAEVPSGLSHTPPQETKKKQYKMNSDQKNVGLHPLKHIRTYSK